MAATLVRRARSCLVWTRTMGSQKRVDEPEPSAGVWETSMVNMKNAKRRHSAAVLSKETSRDSSARSLFRT